MRDLNTLYRRYPALYELDDVELGFRWIDANDSLQSVASFVRYSIEEAGAPMETAPPTRRTPVGEPRRAAALSAKEEDAVTLAGAEKVDTGPLALLGAAPKKAARKKGLHVVFVGNFTPVPRIGYRVGVPRCCRYLEVLNTDAKIYGGSGMGNLGVVAVEDVPSHGFPQSLLLTLPPLGVLYLVPELAEDPEVEEPEEKIAAPAGDDLPETGPEMETMVSGEDPVASTERSTGSWIPRGARRR
jgi:1,4-alpha-glucan branching enzyme